MRFLIIGFGMLAVLARPALAAGDNKIVIKNKDGTVTEFIIPEESRNRPVAVPPEREPQRREPAPAPRYIEDIAPAPEPVASEPLAEPEPAAKEAERGTTEHLLEAPVAPLSTEVEAVKEPEPAPAPKKVAKAAPVKPRLPIPGRKPLLQPAVMEAAATLPPGDAIPESLAVSIAIENAPAATDMKVLRRVHNGIPVYAIVFKTEEGPVPVLVDARNGDIIPE